jgi:hypothetical protein
MTGRLVVLVAAIAAAVVLAPQVAMVGDAGAGAVPRAPLLVRFAPEPTAQPTPACDPAESLFAAMFVRLSAQALANAGKTPDGLFDAGLADREAFEALVGALGIPVDESQLDALTAGFPTASGLSLDSGGDC